MFSGSNAPAYIATRTPVGLALTVVSVSSAVTHDA